MRISDQQLREFLSRGMVAQASADAVAPNKGKKRREHPEDDMQRAVCQFWELCYPATWEMTFHPPNGLAAKSRTLAAIFKGLGVKPGVFDLVCISRRGPFSGFAMELKAPGREASSNQDEWRARFAREGWHTVVTDSLDTAIRAVRDYNELPGGHGARR